MLENGDDAKKKYESDEALEYMHIANNMQSSLSLVWHPDAC